VRTSCYRELFERTLAAKEIQPASILEFGSIEAMKKCARSGLGLAFLPQMAVEAELANGQLASIPWEDLKFNIFTQIVYRKDKWLSPALSALIQLSKELIK